MNNKVLAISQIPQSILVDKSVWREHVQRAFDMALAKALNNKYSTVHNYDECATSSGGSRIVTFIATKFVEHQA